MAPFAVLLGNADFFHAATVLDLDGGSTKAEKRRSYNALLYTSPGLIPEFVKPRDRKSISLPS